MSDDDIDDFVKALQERGWDKPSNTSALAPEDAAVVKRWFGATNARRMATTPKGGRVRLVRTSEVYAVKNSRGWLVGAIEGNRRKVIDEGLDTDRRDQALNLARELGYKVVVHNNPTIFERDDYRPPAPAPRLNPDPRRPDRPPVQHEPSKRFQILKQLGSFKA